MQCQECNDNFKENELDLSHDIPRYMGGTDSDGRHYLCRKCHHTYEKMVFDIAFKSLPSFTQDKIRDAIKSFAKNHFKKDDENTEGVTKK